MSTIFALIFLSLLTAVSSSSWFQMPNLATSLLTQSSLRGSIIREVISREREGRVSPAPSCDSLECPPYKLVHGESDFEIRRYRDSVFVETESIDDVSFLKATYRGFKSLFDYIQGENLNATKVPMTAPVLTSIVPSAGPFCSSAFAVQLYLPIKFADFPPTPKDSQKPKLHITSSGEFCVAVRKFGGFATDFNVADEAASLAASLKTSRWADVVDSNSTSNGYSVAQYNSPFEFTKRVNEIWVNISVKGKDLDSCLPS